MTYEELEKMPTLDLVNLRILIRDLLIYRGCGQCHCGNILLAVNDDETPYQFCSRQCYEDYKNEKK